MGTNHLLVAIVIISMTFKLAFCQDNTDNIYAINGVNIITMTSEEIIVNQTVLVKGNRIIGINDLDKVKIPDEALIIDGTGKYLIPGLADMHTHYGETLDYSYLNLFAAYGVTTIRDLPQGYPATLLKMRDEIRSGKRFGPQIIVANHLMGNETDPSSSIQPTGRSGYDGVKLNSHFTADEFKETVAEANKCGLYTLGHIPFTVDIEDLLASGYQESSHVLELTWYLAEIDRELIGSPQEAEERTLTNLFTQFSGIYNLSDDEIEKLYRAKIKSIVGKIADSGLSFTTTLITDYDIMKKMLDIESIKNSDYSNYISSTFWNKLQSGKDKHINLFEHKEYARLVYKISCMLFKELVENDILLVLGTDVGPTYLSYIPGLSVHDELKLLVENGLTPYQALLTSTRNASIISKKMCGADDFGTIEVGKRSDLVLLENNPLDDIANTRNITGVLIHGNYYEKTRLDSIKNIRKEGIRPYLTDVYEKEGIDETVKHYYSFKEENYFNEYFYNENTLLIIAYELLNKNLFEDAIKLFALNTKEYPYSSNAFDSLGEAYLKSGNKELAIENYEKSLELDPQNNNAREIMKTLK